MNLSKDAQIKNKTLLYEIHMSISGTPVLNYYATITSIGTVDIISISVLITS